MNHILRHGQRFVRLRDGSDLKLERWEGRYEPILIDFQSIDEDSPEWRIYESAEIIGQYWHLRIPSADWCCGWCGCGSRQNLRLLYGIDTPQLTVFKDTVCPECEARKVEYEYIALRKAGKTLRDALREIDKL